MTNTFWAHTRTQRGSLLSNIDRGSGNTHIIRFHYDEHFHASVIGFGVASLYVWSDREAAMRETVRLYGSHFGVYIEEFAPYGVDQFLDPETHYSIWIEHTSEREDLSLFWRLYEYHCMEMAKA